VIQKKTQKSLKDKVIGNNFLNRTPTAKKIRARIEESGCIKLKSFCRPKKTVTVTNGQSEKIFSSYTCDNGLKIT
jgi:hypothetical protein